jgi:hypothetical protein
MRSISDVMTEMLSASDLLAAAIVKRINPADDEINKTTAYELYGRGWVDEATAKGLLHPRRKGHAKNSPVMYSKHEIMALIESERQAVNRLKTYICNR